MATTTTISNIMTKNNIVFNMVSRLIFFIVKVNRWYKKMNSYFIDTESAELACDMMLDPYGTCPRAIV